MIDRADCNSTLVVVPSTVYAEAKEVMVSAAELD